MFFTQIHQMMTEGVDLTLVMRKAQGQLTVSVMPKSNSLKDGAQNHLVPLTLSGTPPELDAGFFAATMQPMQRVAGLISNMAEFEKQAQTAAASSKAAKEKEQKTSKDTKEPKEVKEKREKYEKYLKKAEELIAAKNYSDAIMAYQQARLVATEEQKKKVDEKIAAAKMEQAQGSLFENPTSQPTPEQQAQPIQQPTSQTSQAQMAPQMPQQAPAMQQQSMPPQQAGAMPQQQFYQPAAAPQQMPPQYAQPLSSYPTGGYQQEQQQPMPQYGPRYGQQYASVEPAQSYNNPDYPPTHRPEEYAGYVDFPQGMVAPTPVNPNF